MIQTKTTLIIGACALATVVSIRFATAQTPNDWRQTTEDAQPQQLVLNQEYRGARPGTGNPLPRVAELREKEGLWITWPGFMMTDDGGSRVFLQTTGPLQYKIKAGKKKVVMTFHNTSVFLYNNRNPLVTQHFNTPVARINLKKRKKTTELILSMKTEAAPSVSQLTDADGYNYLFIDFGPGNYPQGGGAARRPSYNSSTSESMVNDSTTNDFTVPDEIQ
ncbi:MAG: hypothetical protein JXX14_12895 [Deltaproteobacteria bacterium]|nr:hypothetical protein [Deltaproteobacteria bacterium]